MSVINGCVSYIDEVINMLLILSTTEVGVQDSKFDKIYFSYRNLMFTVAYHLLHNKEDAQDAVQEAFLSIAMNLDKVPNEPSTESRAYAVTVVKRKACDILRHRPFVPSAEYDDAIGIVITLQESNGLEEAMSSLSKKYREVLLLRFHNGYSAKEVAEMLNISQSVTQKLMWRAKEALRKQLENEGVYI